MRARLAFIAPQWQNVKTFALESAGQFRPKPPAGLTSQAFLDQALHVMDVQTKLAVKEECRWPEFGIAAGPLGAVRDVPIDPRQPYADRPARPGLVLLLKRAIDLDLAHCPNCGGTLSIIAAILEPAQIEKVRWHLGPQGWALPRSPARRRERHAA